jgi:hypothetical protein
MLDLSALSTGVYRENSMVLSSIIRLSTPPPRSDNVLAFVLETLRILGDRHSGCGRTNRADRPRPLALAPPLSDHGFHEFECARADGR